MKAIKSIFTIIIFISASFISAQDSEKMSKEEMRNYYKVRAKEDAKFEQDFKAASKADEKKFWKEQKEYEKGLEERDHVAYNAYMQGKKDAYSEHYEHCNNHCEHSRHYHYYANFYYNGYYKNERRHYKRTTNTSIKIGTPSVRLGLF
ncbi:hypothetical protein [Polaribacter sp. L3A8]|uniref:hypothetical protein n=1 Tax=Polaribacter sp. L3A8 TaxID=2686361 RepID=UPI00131BBEF6|nr:hypothetical protein [Polaribacter sp. L3A8]